MEGAKQGRTWRRNADKKANTELSGLAWGNAHGGWMRRAAQGKDASGSQRGGRQTPGASGHGQHGGNGRIQWRQGKVRHGNHGCSTEQWT